MSMFKIGDTVRVKEASGERRIHHCYHPGDIVTVVESESVAESYRVHLIRKDGSYGPLQHIPTIELEPFSLRFPSMPIQKTNTLPDI